jgi:tocopherol cyclase
MADLWSIWHPDAYHGWPRHGRSFEGWYFKLIDAREARPLAIIPGIFHSPDPAQAHSFIQVYDSANGRTVYHRFPAEVFHSERHAFQIAIGANHFSRERIVLDLNQDGQRLFGEVVISPGTRWPVRALSPGTMGPFAFFPGMECYHGVINLDCTLTGSLNLDGTTLSLDGGRGYMEKDWGRTFPQSYVWTQSNHFEQPGTSLVASVARIPWLGMTFTGFLAGLWHEGRLYRFATYTGARLEALHVDDQYVSLSLASGINPFARERFRLSVRAQRSSGVRLHEPTTTGMVERVIETLSAKLDVQLLRLQGNRQVVVFTGHGRLGGLEVGGNSASLRDNQ